MKAKHFDTVIIGAGISGISAAHYMQTDCPDKTYVILEGRERIGGTWDLFRYPGIRSDSDMYTFGFAFKPWTAPKSIAPREAIIDYLQETIEEENIEPHIRFNHRVQEASWSSDTALWTLKVTTATNKEPLAFTCSFLSFCVGYYDYDNPHTPQFKGIESYEGQTIHPQHWSEDIDYTDKNIVVIGSGATAMTLIPSLAERATHVTMLQRSPTYVVSAPSEDWIAKLLNKCLPLKIAYKINRFRKILFQRYSYAFARAYPKTMKNLILKGIKKELGDDFDVDTHFTPSYDPWDQRICLVPDSDLFNAIKEKKASIVTDHIDTFTKDGIRLKSGQELKADLIVTATGLNASIMEKIAVSVDGDPVDFSKTVAYRGTMFSDIPNAGLAFGYTNASWTLKCDLTNQFMCRLINHMDANGFKKVTPRLTDPEVEMLPFLDFTPGYILRVIDKLPRMGSKEPWKLKQNYFYDKSMLKNVNLDDGVLEFK